jgi:peptide chain release factor 2
LDGQRVNKTDPAVRTSHVPTGIAVVVQQERSHQNCAKAIAMLKARLYEVELQKHEAERAETEANKTDIGWEHQIRSYVLQPYQMVRDLRTGAERSDPQKVLDADLGEFIAASLAARMGEGGDKEAA